MLPIRRRCHFALDTQKGWKALKIRYRIRYGGGYVTSIFIGYRAEPDKWSRESERCLKNTTHGDDRTPASEINRALQLTEEAVESAFRYYEEEERLPTPDELKDKYAEIIGRALGLSSPRANKSGAILSGWDEYIRTESVRRGWSIGYIDFRQSSCRALSPIIGGISYSDMSDKVTAGIVSALSSKGTANATISNYITSLKSYLYWCRDKGLIPPSVDIGKACAVSLRKGSDTKSDVYLTWEELSRLRALDTSRYREELSKDLLLLACFTGMRYSDLIRLERKDITDTHIRYYAKKTSTYTEVNINNYSREIINKYMPREGADGRLMPSISHSTLNSNIKKLCQRAGIDTPITRLKVSGGVSREVTMPKYELVSIHTGRHTFVVAALTLGIPTEVIRKFTGHKSLDAMASYIAIVDDLKAREMEKFNRPL